MSSLTIMSVSVSVATPSRVWYSTDEKEGRWEDAIRLHVDDGLSDQGKRRSAATPRRSKTTHAWSEFLTNECNCETHALFWDLLID